MFLPVPLVLEGQGQGVLVVEPDVEPDVVPDVVASEKMSWRRRLDVSWKRRLETIWKWKMMTR